MELSKRAANIEIISIKSYTSRRFQRVYSLVPEAVGDVFALVVEPLVGAALVERPALGAVRPDFHIIEGIPDLRFHLFAARIQSKGHGGMGSADMGGQGQQSGGIIPLSQEKETVHTEIIRDQGIRDGRGQFLPYILFKERGMASNAISPAIAYFNCQGNTVRNLLQDHGRHLRNVLDHFSL